MSSIQIAFLVYIFSGELLVYCVYTAPYTVVALFIQELGISLLLVSLIWIAELVFGKVAKNPPKRKSSGLSLQSAKFQRQWEFLRSLIADY